MAKTKQKSAAAVSFTADGSWEDDGVGGSPGRVRVSVDFVVDGAVSAKSVQAALDGVLRNSALRRAVLDEGAAGWDSQDGGIS